MIECPNWRPCNIPDGGCCAAGRYAGAPSLGCCRVCLTIQQTEREKGDATAPGLFAKAVSYAIARASSVVGAVPDADRDARLAACAGCEALRPLPAPQVGYCLACGCGETALAELTVKAAMPAATCPKKKWAT